MQIKSAKIENYKSFLSSEEIGFSPGFNVIVGRNNIGKTALLEALTLRLGNKPHRSLNTKKNRGKAIPTVSKTHLVFRLEASELSEMVSAINASRLFVVGDQLRFSPNTFGEGILNVLNGPTIDFAFTLEGGSPSLPYFPEIGVPDPNNVIGVSFERTSDGNLRSPAAPTGVRGTAETLNGKLANILMERIYSFKAERLNIGDHRMGNNPTLLPNAANLAQVLNFLQTNNSERFNLFNARVQRIFPEIKRVAVPPIDDNNVRIYIWTVDPISQRDDLAIELSDSGTGIAQVLAILYVLLTSDSPQVIIIDEPQSFLHPGAVRKLFEIMKSYPQHQYIITTHSPTALSSADISTLMYVNKQEAESIVEVVNADDIMKLRLILSDVGVRLSDVFGADQVLWVEGPTEENCFPEIVSKVLHRKLWGTIIIGVVNTGDFEGKDKGAATKALDIYARVSNSGSILPSAVGYIFDREERTDQYISDLERRGIIFINRRLYENYLLNRNAIEYVLNQLDTERSEPVSHQEIEVWLNEHGLEAKYFKPHPIPASREAEQWLKQVHGAEILNDLFNFLTDTRYPYLKTVYGPMLTNWIAENSPNDLQELAELLGKFIPESN